MTLYYKVAAQTPFNQSIITYSHQGEPLSRGTLVIVPLGSRSIEACVLQETTELDTDAKKIKAMSGTSPSRLRNSLAVRRLTLRIQTNISQFSCLRIAKRASTR